MEHSVCTAGGSKDQMFKSIRDDKILQLLWPATYSRPR